VTAELNADRAQYLRVTTAEEEAALIRVTAPGGTVAKVGDRIEITDLADPTGTFFPGDRGTVTAVGDDGVLEVRWDTWWNRFDRWQEANYPPEQRISKGC
jgi:hypothetical protein